MSTTATRPNTTNPSGHPTTGRPAGRDRRRLIALVIVLAVLATAALLAWWLVGGSPRATRAHQHPHRWHSEQLGPGPARP